MPYAGGLFQQNPRHIKRLEAVQRAVAFVHKAEVDLANSKNQKV